MHKTIKLVTLLGFVVLLTTGCATNRSEVQLTTPVSQTTQTHAPKGVNVLIRSVKDDRKFEAAPSDPSIPSLGFEGSANATQELKAKAIARKRNGFGKALGDVVLQDGQTVPGIIGETLTGAFKQAGFNVVTSEAAAGNSPLIVDVRIKKFWAWMTPGFWALTFQSKIEADLNIQGKSTPLTIQADATDSRQLGTDSAWMEITGKGLQEFQEKAVSTVAALP